MSRWERSGERDLGMSQWHREQFGTDCHAFDIDLIGMCLYCAQPLYAWECTRADQKSTRWLEKVCAFMNIPGYLVRYSNGEDGRVESITARLVFPVVGQRVIGQAEHLALHIKDLRGSHHRLWHER